MSDTATVPVVQNREADSLYLYALSTRYLDTLDTWAERNGLERGRFHSRLFDATRNVIRRHMTVDKTARTVTFTFTADATGPFCAIAKRDRILTLQLVTETFADPHGLRAFLMTHLSGDATPVHCDELINYSVRCVLVMSK